MFAVDTHVHLYREYDATRLFRAAAAHAAKAAQQAGIVLESLVLCLTEGSDAGAFETLARGERGVRCAPTGEPVALRVEGFGLPIFMVRGRQIVSREGLETLAIGRPGQWPDRQMDLGDLIARIAADGGRAIVPWGVGKWRGHRGAVLRELIRRDDRPPFALGDNGGRPWFWAWPRHFRLAAARGIAILPGSDPLPIPGEEATAGRCLAVAEAEIDPAHPATSLVRALSEGRFSPLAAGGREKLGRFIRNQYRIRRTKTSRV